jgi:hypothetical protein
MISSTYSNTFAHTIATRGHTSHTRPRRNGEGRTLFVTRSAVVAITAAAEDKTPGLGLHVLTNAAVALAAETVARAIAVGSRPARLHAVANSARPHFLLGGSPLSALA